MVKLVTVEEMRQIEAEADANGIAYAEMMERAGQMAARQALIILDGVEAPIVTVIVGKGNNGGDGLVAARYLADQTDVRCYLIERLPDDFPPYQQAQSAGLFMAYAEDDDGRVLRHMIASADLVIDALFGIGVRLPLRDEAARILRGANQALNARRRELPPDVLYVPQNPEKQRQIAYPRVLAIDCPSGVNCDTGEIDSNVIHADVTITFITPKIGQTLFPAAQMIGELVIAPLGISHDMPTMQAVSLELMTSWDVPDLLPPRPADSNKGTFGKAMIVSGCTAYSGAPSLCAEAAYRVGTGLVAIASTPEVIGRTRLREAIFVTLEADHGAISAISAPALKAALGDYDALLIGPGMSQSETTAVFLFDILTDETPPLVLDADALNILAKREKWWQALPKDTIITPHPGEMGRLAGVSTADVQADRLSIAREKAAEWGVVLILKGAHTIIATPEGVVNVLPFKSDALATAGTGDVLAGMVTGFRAQGMNAHSAAVAGAYLHGVAGAIAADELSGRSVIAGDVLDAIPSAIKTL